MDIVGEWWDAAEGHQSLDLNGEDRGAIFQDLKTEPGRTYYLTFSLAASPDSPPQKLTFQLMWDGKVAANLQIEKKDDKERDPPSHEMGDARI